MDLEARLRALPDQLDDVRAPDGLAAAVRDRRRRHRRRDVLVVAAAVAVLAVAGGAAVTLRPIAAPVATPEPSGPPPTDTRLLPWPARGPLLGDAALVRGVLAAAVAREPTQELLFGAAHLLWIGPATDGPALADGSVLFAVTQQYSFPSRDGARSALYLRTWRAGPDRVWRAYGGQVVDHDAVALELPWSLATTADCAGIPAPGGFPAPTGGPPTANPVPSTRCDQARLLVLAEPGVRSITYAFPGQPDRTVTGGTALVTGPVPVPELTFRDRIAIPVRVTRADGGVRAAADPIPLYGAGSTAPPEALGWGSPRGSVSPDDAIPGLRLWGRLHGLPGLPGGNSPDWGGTLADGSRVQLLEPQLESREPFSLAFVVTPPGAAPFLVRDLPNPAVVVKVPQVSAFVPLSDGRCELLVVGAPGTTAISYADGSAATDLPVADGVGTLVVPSCAGHDQARITVRTGGDQTYAGPVDSTRPGGGVKHG